MLEMKFFEPLIKSYSAMNKPSKVSEFKKNLETYTMRAVSCLVFFLLLGACKTKTNLVNSRTLKTVSAKKIIKKNYATSFDAKTLEAKLKVGYSENWDKQQKMSLTVRLRMQKDSVIWIKGSYALLNVFRARITPKTFSYYSLIDKSFFDGNFAFLEKLFGTKITFNQVQNILLGESILNLKNQKYFSEIEGPFYKLTPKEAPKSYRAFFFFDPVNFKIKRQFLQLKKGTSSLQIDYSHHTSYDSQLIPKKIEVTVNTMEGYAHFGIDFKSIVLNRKITTPYKIPPSYQPIKMQ